MSWIKNLYDMSCKCGLEDTMLVRMMVHCLFIMERICNLRYLGKIMTHLHKLCFFTALCAAIFTADMKDTVAGHCVNDSFHLKRLLDWLLATLV